jgi:putative PIN family toxin of toxin-antitoxin system
MKVVADTMIWISYCTRKEGHWHRLVERARRQQVRFFVSGYILDELTTCLIEDLKESRRFANLARKSVLRIAKLIILPPTIRPYVPGDRNDDPIVQTGLSAKSDYLITADTEILKLRKIQDLEIIHPSQLEQNLLSK